MPHDANQDKI